MNTCETCRYYFGSPLEEPCESCHWDGVIGQDPTNWEAPTNADKLRAMTDEELAEWLVFVERRILERQPTLGRPALYADWLDWLKNPVEEGDDG